MKRKLGMSRRDLGSKRRKITGDAKLGKVAEVSG